MWRLLGLVVAVAVLALLPVGRRVTAQPAPPDTYPVTPDPVECGIAPRTAEEIAPLLAASPVVEPDPVQPFAIPPGDPVDPATEAFVASIVREAVACGNAAGILGAASLLSDAAIAGGFDADLLTFGETAPSETERRSLLAVLDVRDHGDGRLGALAIVADPTRRPAATMVYLVLAEHAAGTGGSDVYFYLIDDVIADPFGFGGASSTPNP